LKCWITYKNIIFLYIKNYGQRKHFGRGVTLWWILESRVGHGRPKVVSTKELARKPHFPATKFFAKIFVLSNHYPCNITIAAKTFNSSEQELGLQNKLWNTLIRILFNDIGNICLRDYFILKYKNFTGRL
jgi:hypothetical protein